MLRQSYWKVMLRYGHVRGRNEVYTVRYLAFDEGVTLLNGYNSAKIMPEVKGTRGVNSVKKIEYTEYYARKETEKSNFYLQKLMSFNETVNNAA